MGVFGLWDILLTTAQKISVQDLNGKVLAIDASIWLVKAQSIFADDSQKIRCILEKIVFLRKNNVIPIFVFDGIPPAIKRRTLEKRRQKIRQGSEIDIRKKTQIEVMQLLQNEGREKEQKQSSKQKRLLRQEEQMSQIDKLLQSLSQVEGQKSKLITDDDIMKIKLQSQVLTYKYQMLLEDPRLLELQKIQLDDFQLLENQQKLQYLHLIDNQLQSRNSKKKILQINKQFAKLTPQQQIFYDIEKIQKKTKLRQLQDQLYRKTLQQNTKVENGFQIIQEVRNGKKFVMKRKINEIKDKTSWLGKGIKKQKNDFKAIFNYDDHDDSQKQTIQKDQYDLFGNQPDPFLADLIGKDLKINKQDSNKNSTYLQIQSKTLIAQLNKKLPSDSEYSIRKKHKIKNSQEKLSVQSRLSPKTHINTSQTNNKTTSKKIEIASQQMSEKESEEIDNYLQNTFSSHQLRLLKQQQHQNQQNSQHDNQKNPDHLPQFINYQNLLIHHLHSEDQRNLEFQTLLEMIGIPYIKATSEAEAQCAHLEKEGFVDGIVTEDSDIFLFGARNVFRGVFNDNIKYFSSQKILQKLKLNRQKLIIFAMLLGSDYTEGIKGIGVVNAMQILKIFDDFDKLQKFKKWARYADILHADPSNTTQYIIKQLSNEQQKSFFQFHKKFKNYWYIDDDFPKISVIQAYLKPDVIDEYRIRQMKQTKYFDLKQFIEEPVKIFMKQRLLLTYSEVQTYCHFLKKPFKKEHQQKITNYFIGQDHQFAKIRSKRLLKAIELKLQSRKSNEQEQNSS